MGSTGRSEAFAAVGSAGWGIRDYRGTAALTAALVGAGGVAVGLTLGFSVWAALGTIVQDLPAWEPLLVLRYPALLVATATIGELLAAWRASRTSPASLLASSGT